LEAVNKELQEEGDRMRSLVTRQYELIKILGEQMGHLDKDKEEDEEDSSKQLSKAQSSLIGRIKTIRESLIASSGQGGAKSGSQISDLNVIRVLGKGSFGTVFLGDWRGTQVAVKRMVLNSNSTAERMAAMEVAISQGMSHPHLVQTVRVCST
jgi:hypothetical protein